MPLMTTCTVAQSWPGLGDSPCSRCPASGVSPFFPMLLLASQFTPAITPPRRADDCFYRSCVLLMRHYKRPITGVPLSGPLDVAASKLREAMPDLTARAVSPHPAPSLLNK